MWRRVRGPPLGLALAQLTRRVVGRLTWAQVCHEGHDLVYSAYSRFFCDCGAGAGAPRAVACKCLQPAPLPASAAAARAGGAKGGGGGGGGGGVDLAAWTVEGMATRADAW